MSIRRARLNGETVNADLGEALRNKELKCIICNALLHVHRYPLSDDYHFALNPGERHTRACRRFDKEGVDIPRLTETVADFVYRLMTVGRERKDGSGQNDNTHNKTDDEPSSRHHTNKLSSLKGIINSGCYFYNPNDIALDGTNVRYIDLVIFDRWAKKIWSTDLVDIGPRVIDSRWIGSFRLHPTTIHHIEKMIECEHELWFKTFWRTEHDEYASVLFRLDIRNCYSSVRKKLFVNGKREDRTFTNFIPAKAKEGEPLDVLVASDWIPMPFSECKSNCPLQKCEGCIGAYWGKCNSPKQIEFFPIDNDTKNREKNE